MKNKIKRLTRKILPIVAVVLIMITTAIPCFASEIPDIPNSYVEFSYSLCGDWDISNIDDYIENTYYEDVYKNNSLYKTVYYMGEMTENYDDFYIELYSHDFYINCDDNSSGEFYLTYNGVVYEHQYLIKYSSVGSGEVIEKSGATYSILGELSGSIYVHELYLYMDIEPCCEVGFSVPQEAYLRHDEFNADTEEPTNEGGIYQGIYNIINNQVFGGLAVEGTLFGLVAIVVSLISCLFLIALPFLLVFLIIRLMRG